MVLTDAVVLDVEVIPDVQVVPAVVSCQNGVVDLGQILPWQVVVFDLGQPLTED